MPQDSEAIPGQTWKAGAEALAQFQKTHTGVAKGGVVTGGPRSGSKYANLTDILKVCSQAATFGLSHTGQSRMVGNDLLIWREVLHHTSGESIYAEVPVLMPGTTTVDKYGKERHIQPGERYQTFGGLITYARKYALQGLFGLYADDGLDPDGESYNDQAAASAPPAPVPAPVTVPQPQSRPVAPIVDDNATAEQTALDEEQIKVALSIIKDPIKGAEWKKEFMSKFYPNAEKLFPNMISNLRHLEFLDALQNNVPF